MLEHPGDRNGEGRREMLQGLPIRKVHFGLPADTDDFSPHSSYSLNWALGSNFKLNQY